MTLSNILDEERLGLFRYYDLANNAKILGTNPGHCDCCEKEVADRYNDNLEDDSGNWVCPECIASGKAHEKFGSIFNGSRFDVIKYRTPGLYSRLQFEVCWEDCCDEPCRYVCCISDLKELYENDKNVGATISPRLVGKSYNEAVRMIFDDAGLNPGKIYEAEDGTSYNVYVFVCLKCGKFRAVEEYD